MPILLDVRDRNFLSSPLEGYWRYVRAPYLTLFICQGLRK